MNKAIATAATIGLAIGLGTGVLVPRITEVSRVSALMQGDTVAYGAIHVTVDTLSSGEPGIMVTAPLDHLGGLDAALLHDADYQRALRYGLTGGELYDDAGMPRGELHAVVPVLHRPDILLVAFSGGRWIYLHRTRWDRLGGAL